MVDVEQTEISQTGTEIQQSSSSTTENITHLSSSSGLDKVLCVGCTSSLYWINEDAF